MMQMAALAQQMAQQQAQQQQGEMIEQQG